MVTDISGEKPQRDDERYCVSRETKSFFLFFLLSKPLIISLHESTPKPMNFQLNIPNLHHLKLLFKVKSNSLNFLNFPSKNFKFSCIFVPLLQHYFCETMCMFIIGFIHKHRACCLMVKSNHLNLC